MEVDMFHALDALDLLRQIEYNVFQMRAVDQTMEQSILRLHQLLVNVSALIIIHQLPTAQYILALVIPHEQRAREVTQPTIVICVYLTRTKTNSTSEYATPTGKVWLTAVPIAVSARHTAQFVPVQIQINAWIVYPMLH